MIYSFCVNAADGRVDVQVQGSTASGSTGSLAASEFASSPGARSMGPPLAVSLLAFFRCRTTRGFKMKKIVPAMMAVVFALLAFTVSAQEMSVRKGVVTGISPIQVQGQGSQSGQSSAAGGVMGRMFGRAIGRAAVRASGQYAYEVAEVADGAIQDATSGAASGGGRTVTAYMVMIRFDDGNESAIQSAQSNNLRVGGRVRVFGSGSSSQIVAE